MKHSCPLCKDSLSYVLSLLHRHASRSESQGWDPTWIKELAECAVSRVPNKQRKFEEEKLREKECG